MGLGGPLLLGCIVKVLFYIKFSWNLISSLWRSLSYPKSVLSGGLQQAVAATTPATTAPSPLEPTMDALSCGRASPGPVSGTMAPPGLMVGVEG